MEATVAKELFYSAEAKCGADIESGSLSSAIQVHLSTSSDKPDRRTARGPTLGSPESRRRFTSLPISMDRSKSFLSESTCGTPKHEADSGELLDESLDACDVEQTAGPCPILTYS